MTEEKKDDTFVCQIMRKGSGKAGKQRARCRNPSEMVLYDVHVCLQCFAEAMGCMHALGEGGEGAMYYLRERAMVAPRAPQETHEELSLELQKRSDL